MGFKSRRYRNRVAGFGRNSGVRYGLLPYVFRHTRRLRVGKAKAAQCRLDGTSRRLGGFDKNEAVAVAQEQELFLIRVKEMTSWDVTKLRVPLCDIIGLLVPKSRAGVEERHY